MLSMVLVVLSLGAGCEKDTDCKGDRICEAGHCVSPHAGESAPEPQPAPAVQPERVAEPTPSEPSGGCVAPQVNVRGRCCWPGQDWSRPAQRCIGPPTCPPGALVDQERCVAQDGSPLPSGAQVAATAPAPPAEPPPPDDRQLPASTSPQKPARAVPAAPEPRSIPDAEDVAPPAAAKDAAPPAAPPAEPRLASSRPFVAVVFDASEIITGLTVGYVGLLTPGVGVELGLLLTGSALFGANTKVIWAGAGLWLGLRFTRSVALAFSVACGPAGILRSGDVGRSLFKMDVGARFDFVVQKSTALFFGYDLLPLNGVAHLISFGVSYQ